MTETLPSPTATVSPRKRLFTAIKWTVCLVTISFVGYALWKNLRNFDWRNFHPNLFFVLAAGLSIVGVTITQIIAYRLLLAAYGPKAHLAAGGNAVRGCRVWRNMSRGKSSQSGRRFICFASIRFPLQSR